MIEVDVCKELSNEQAEQLVALYKQGWWSSDRSLQDVKTILRHSVSCALIEKSSKKLIAYARAITDRFSFALICDVLVDEQYRGQQIGKKVVDELLSDPELQHVAKIELRCLPDLEPFYKKFGFSQPQSPLVTMIHNQ